MTTAVPMDSLSWLRCVGMSEKQPIDPKDVCLVRQGFARVSSMPEATAAIFCRRLFALDPALQPRYRLGATDQSRMLMQLIEAAVRLLDRPEALLPTLEGLGRRHAGRGIRSED